MRRPGPDTLSLVLVWLPVAGAIAATGARLSPGLVLTVTGLCALAAMWLILLGVIRRRQSRAGELSREIGDLLEDAGEPRASEDHELDVLHRAVLAVRRARRTLAPSLRAGKEEIARLTSALDGTGIPVLATDPAGDVRVANAAAEEFLEKPGAVIGRNFEDLFTQQEVLELHRGALAGRAGTSQVRIRRADSQRVFQVLATPARILRAPAQRFGAVVTIRDITDLATAVQLKTDFVANASHELRTPLSAIRGAIETLADGAWDDPAMRQRLTAMIAVNASRLEELVRDLLDLSRLESPEAPAQIVPLSLPDLAADLAATFEPRCAERKLRVELALDPALSRMHSDPKLLRLILGNLIDNASKFAYEGTPVRVTGEVIPSTGRLDAARLRVIDQGVGVPLPQQARIFERFFQGGDASRTGGAERRGTGLGLAIVKHAVKALGGTVGVQSVWQQGTTMIVDLPACVEKAAAAPPDMLPT